MGRRLLVTGGLVVAAFGLLFLLQGLGVVRWPASSFMIGAKVWVTWGSAIMVIGLGLVLIGRRLR
jgi:hypothetical protein